MTESLDIREEQIEKAILIAVGKKGSDRDLAFEHLDELESLAETAGAEVIEKIYQEPDKPNNKTVIGKGKLEEIKLTILEENISLIIFDDELSPAQVRNLEFATEIKVIDRSGLILDIFAKHAKTIAAKTQVELAQTEYMLPRLTRMWTHLSKQFGGIGTKGPGETQIETDRRHLRIKIQRLKEKLKTIQVQKEQQGKGRSELPKFALVGYTNVGKSTLMNILTEAEVLVEDKLFATLDTTVRLFKFPNGQKALLSDTVGFIRKLPTHLIESFRSTLTEAVNADILIHIIDITHKQFEDQIKVVDETLKHLKIEKKSKILVFNKTDALESPEEIRAIQIAHPNAIFISAKRGINIATLLDTMQKKYDEQAKILNFILPYHDMNKINEIYTLGNIRKREDKDEGIYFEIRVNQDKYDYFNHHFGKYVN